MDERSAESFCETSILMNFHRERLSVQTAGRGTWDVTDRVAGIVEVSGVDEGICHVFVHHTSASLMICENADPAVRVDLESWFARAVRDGDPMFTHTDEGPDDMSAHVRSVLTATTLTIPVRQGRLDLGTWQGIFLWEHRTAPHARRLTVTVWGPGGH